MRAVRIVTRGHSRYPIAVSLLLFMIVVFLLVHITILVHSHQSHSLLSLAFTVIIVHFCHFAFMMIDVVHT
jgi:hypothetical protein